MTKLVLRAGTALLCTALAASFAHRAFAQVLNCPCTIWPASALRFYKGALNTGTHVGHLWSATGTRLAEATFAGETLEGWQEVQLSPAVPITANTTYIASYHSASGYFAFDNGFF